VYDTSYTLLKLTKERALLLQSPWVDVWLAAKAAADVWTCAAGDEAVVGVVSDTVVGAADHSLGADTS